MVVYLDCAATSPVDLRVSKEVIKYTDYEFGNAGSRSHNFGNRAKSAVEKARSKVAKVVNATRGEIIFTSGATESNNLAILGLSDYGLKIGKNHIISTKIEHKSVLESLEILANRGFKVTLLAPNSGGWIEPKIVYKALRDNTLLVSVMQVNNETGVIQPIRDIASLLKQHHTYFHVDAAQGFGKELEEITEKRIDMISLSGHKIYGPKGIGALVIRRRDGKRPPLLPLMYGGGQELGLRPGTLPVPLIVGLGKAAELSRKESLERNIQSLKFKRMALKRLRVLNPIFNGDLEKTVPQMINITFPGILADEAMEALSEIVAISNGSACTSTSDSCSHVLGSMGISQSQSLGALRLSWCHLTENPDWNSFVEVIKKLQTEVN